MKNFTGKRFTTPSGLGGIFTVVIIETDKTDANRVKVQCTNPDWEARIFWTTRQNLTEVKGA